jgi:hypothetical protein
MSGTPRQQGTSARQRGTNPRNTGTAPTQQGTNPRAIQRAEFDALRADVTECLRLLRQLTATPPAPTQAIHDPERGTFLPGTGWLGGTPDTDGYDVT